MPETVDLVSLIVLMSGITSSADQSSSRRSQHIPEVDDAQHAVFRFGSRVLGLLRRETDWAIASA